MRLTIEKRRWVWAGKEQVLFVTVRMCCSMVLDGSGGGSARRNHALPTAAALVRYDGCCRRSRYNLLKTEVNEKFHPPSERQHWYYNRFLLMKFWYEEHDWSRYIHVQQNSVVAAPLHEWGEYSQRVRHNSDALKLSAQNNADRLDHSILLLVCRIQLSSNK